jgi:hypothetical protein
MECEIEQSILEMKINRAPGDDGIVIEYIKSGAEIIVKKIN